MAVYQDRWWADDHCQYIGQLVGLAKKVDEQGMPLKLVALGCWEGLLTKSIANAVKPQILTCVDSWKGYLEESKCTGIEHPTVVTAKARDVFASFVHNMQHETEGNFMIEREMTIKWVEELKDPLGFICIDCSHDYDTMVYVLRHVMPLVQPNGIICGGAIGAANATRKDLNGGVERAVKEVLPWYLTEGECWYWINTVDVTPGTRIAASAAAPTPAAATPTSAAATPTSAAATPTPAAATPTPAAATPTPAVTSVTPVAPTIAAVYTPLTTDPVLLLLSDPIHSLLPAPTQPAIRVYIDVCFFDGAAPLAATLLKMRIIELQPLVTRFYIVEAGNTFALLADDPIIKEYRAIITYVPVKYYPRENIYNYIVPLLHHDNQHFDTSVVICHQDEIPNVTALRAAMDHPVVSWLAMTSFSRSLKDVHTVPFTRAFTCPLSVLRDIGVYRATAGAPIVDKGGWRFHNFGGTVPDTDVVAAGPASTLPGSIKLLPVIYLDGK